MMTEPSTGSQNDNSGQDIDVFLQSPAKREEILQRLGTMEPGHLWDAWR